MNILVLGGTGYLGKKVVSELLRRGHDVTCTKRAKSRIFQVEGYRLRWINGDIKDIENNVKTISRCFDVVINMACNYGKNGSSCYDVFESNMIFPCQVLNYVVEHGTRKFITVGTGLPNDFNLYSYSKNKFSEIGEFVSNNSNIDFVELKLEMFYGYDEPQNRFFPFVISRMLKGKEVDTTLGYQRRDIIAVEDVVKAIIIVLESDLKGYNKIPVGTGEGPSISEIIDYIWELTGRKSIVNKGGVSLRYKEPDCIADVSVLEGISVWNPMQWKNGLKEMVNKIRG